jgi:hypothetical protein
VRCCQTMSRTSKTSVCSSVSSYSTLNVFNAFAARASSDGMRSVFARAVNNVTKLEPLADSFLPSVD